jgi:carbon-monoxide dehydrogenase medium subunit
MNGLTRRKIGPLGDHVKPAPFAYAKAHSLDHALWLLASEPEAKILAGGQSLIATLNMRLSAPPLLVDINGLGELATIARTGDWLEIGTMVRQREAERSTDIARGAPLIARALPFIAHPAIRNRGTIGGSIAFADPAAELPACLIALDGEMDVQGSGGQRRVKADEFFRGLFETALEAGDILTKIRIPAAREDERFGFAELARRHGDYALVGLAAKAMASGASLKDFRLVYFGVGATPIRARGAEKALANSDLVSAIAALSNDLAPHDDVHASAAARRHLAGVLLRRVLEDMRGAKP